jgi:hypothetical protein
MPPVNLASIFTLDAPSSLPLLLSVQPTSRLIHPSPRKMRVAFHAEFRTAGNAKRVAKEIGYTRRQDRPGTAKRETKMKGNDTGVCSVIADVHAGRRIV